MPDHLYSIGLVDKTRYEYLMQLTIYYLSILFYYMSINSPAYTVHECMYILGKGIILIVM